MKIRLSTFLVALALCAAAGFAASPKIDEAAMSGMREGQTTFDEIVRRFGRPNFSSTSWDGTRTAVYAYGEGRSSAALALPALGAALGSSSEDTVVLYFDDRGVLTGHKLNQAVARPAAQPVTPTVRYVEPSRTGPAPPAEAKPAATSVFKPGEASAAAPVPAGKPAAAQASKPEPRSDGLPSWLPSSSTRGDRY